MPHRILNDDWSTYDNRKKKREDRFFFSPEESWEVDYLVNKIRKFEPYKTEAAIRAAINSCRGVVPAPHPREKFVQCVMGKI